MKKILAAICILAGAVNFYGQNLPPKEKLKMDKFITSLMNKMTIDEKIGQLNFPGGGDVTTGQAKNSNIAEKVRKGNVGAVLNLKGIQKIKEIQKVAVEESRLKIPLFFALDVIHGYETGFPIPLALAATWNMKGIEESAKIAAKEVSADGISLTFSPMVDVSRDPRWGRVSEGSGEDPFLGGEIAKAMVKGYQGDNTYRTNSQIMANVKHYALYGASEAGKDYNTVDMSRQRMFNEYMYPYKAAVDAGVGSVMTSFNDIDGLPASANKWLLDDVLRKQWGFTGAIMTDYTGISEMVDHGIGDLQTVSAKALKAGVDLDMISESYLATLKKSYDEGKISQNEIDRSCRYVLEAKYKMGLFENPYKYIDVNRPAKDIYTKDNRAFARKIAAESFVLLKNDNILPLKKQGTIAVIGPLASTRSNMPGTWSVSVDLKKPATLVEGIQASAGKDVKVLYAKGSHLTEDPELEKRATMFERGLGRENEKRTDQQMIQEAIEVASKSDVIIAALGESSEFSGESSSRTDLNIPDVQQKLLAELLKTGKPVVLLVFDGRPLTLSWEEKNVPAILNVWFGGSEAAPAIADVLFGDTNPSGKLPMTFPQNVGQIPIYYNHKNTGRPLPEGKWFEKFRSNYIDVSNEPLYPFGFGLSYTKFEYGEIKLNATKVSDTGSITASIAVRNTGTREGQEVVQLYIRDLVGSITRPVKELKGFEKITLKPGETKEVIFKITPEDLKFYNYDLQYAAEPGDFELMIGTNSRDVKKAKFTYN
ncbi:MULTISPECIES: beta-glucosidase BglX [Flavobacterium]|uniref:beta-glucosidase BglX n=1 Tax=Flavobacterium TaxID=237 RepID=UPI001181C7CE|nr:MULTISPECIES: beta-glucosidase BglX [Flavobacterium]MCR4030707.1 beta-glucosidase BglX [Flavobacterium panacis]